MLLLCDSKKGKLWKERKLDVVSSNMGAGLSRRACVQNIGWGGKIGRNENEIMNSRIS